MRKRWIPHFIAIAGLLVFGFLGLGSAATAPAAAIGAAAAPAAAPTAEAAEPAAAAPAVPRVIAVENIGDGARVSRAPWALHTAIPSKSYTVVGTIVLRTTSEVTVLADLMERAIAMGGHDIKNVIVTRTLTDDGAQLTSAIAVAIRYTNETLMVRD